MEYNQLKASIAAVIKTNNRKEITGQLLQNVLFQMTNVIGENLQLAGFATPLTDPHEPDQNLFYITDQGGVYPHFDNLTVDDGLTFLMWKNGEWTSHTVGVVTQEWVDSHYVSIEFFRSLFRAYDSAGLEILPNNNPEEALPTVVDNIKAMVGFWTEQYISALGQQTGGGGGGGATSLDELSDVFLTNPSLGQALVFTITPDHPEGIWVNQTIQAGTDMATVWAALAGNTSEQINISHLTDALADYATKTYVDQNFITVAYFDRLFRAYNGNTLVSHNDVTSTIDNIKAMFGFWTEQYLSALGNNSGGGGQLLALSNMADVTLTTPIADKQVLTFDAVTQKWVNGNAQAGATALANLTDVTLTSLASGQTLLYDSTTSKWYNSALKTINGQSLLGSGDISVGGGGGGSYVTYYYTSGSFDANNATAIWNEIQNVPSNVPTSNHGVVIYNGNINTPFELWLPDNRLEIYKRWKSNGSWNSWAKLQGDDPTKLPLAGGTMTGTINFWSYQSDDILLNNAVGEHFDGRFNLTFAQSSGNWSIFANGDRATPVVRVWNNPSGDEPIMRLVNYKDYQYNRNLYIHNPNISAGTTCQLAIGKEASQYNVGEISFYYDGYNSQNNALKFGLYSRANLLCMVATNRVGVGTASPSYKLHVEGTIYATGSITALSDARKKDIMGEAGVTVEQIAHAPAVQFLWKDKERRKDGQQVGTLAQYWQTVLPEVVMDKGGELSMQYGVAALVSAIVTARKVVDHERRITELEKENERLKKKIEQLRLN